MGASTQLSEDRSGGDHPAYTVIVQSLDLGGSAGTCQGFPHLPAPMPTRLVAVADSPSLSKRRDLVESVCAAFANEPENCLAIRNGPGAVDCLANPPTADEWCHSALQDGVRHIMLVIAGDGAPSTELLAVVESWQRRGWELIGAFNAHLDPDDVLPGSIQHQHALSWDSDITEITGDVLETILLAGEDRRAFISYAHSDGQGTAERIAKLLFSLRFDVFLDRYYMEPGIDFPERIDDELIDKAMVVVVETPAAASSRWVQQEANTAIDKGLGCVAVNLDHAPETNRIDELVRIRVNDDTEIGKFIITQHREQLALLRDTKLESVRASLNAAGVRPHQMQRTRAGYRVEVPNQPIYSITIRPRPADLHRFRVAHEQAVGARAVVIHPRPLRPDRWRDLEWLADNGGMFEVDDGNSNDEVRRIARGVL